jgi:hypothetical protein
MAIYHQEAIMTVIPMRLFQGNELTTKLQELAAKNDEDYYHFFDDGSKRFVLSISKQKLAEESDLAKAFWHFFTVHGSLFTYYHVESLLGIHKQISLFSKNEQKSSTLQKIERITATLIIKKHPLKTLEEARSFAKIMESYMREERFGLVGELFTDILQEASTCKKGFTIVSRLMVPESRKKLHEVFKNRSLQSFGCLSYSQHGDSLEGILNQLSPELKKLHIGWGNSTEQLIEYKILPCILRQTKLEELVLGTKEKADHPTEMDLSSLKIITSLTRLQLYNISAKRSTGHTLLDNPSLKELTIFDNASKPFVGQALSGHHLQKLESLHLEGNTQYSIPFLDTLNKLTKLVVLPLPHPKRSPGSISVCNLTAHTQLKTLTLYDDGFDSPMVSQLARNLLHLETMEIKIDHLSVEAFSKLISHPQLKRLRITANTMQMPTKTPASSIDELIIRLDSDCDEIDTLASYIKDIPSIKTFSLASDSCTKSTYTILRSRTVPFELLRFFFSSEAPFTSSDSKVQVYILSRVNDEKYRKLMVTWHEAFPLTL